jgi:hypothetical protein
MCGPALESQGVRAVVLRAPHLHFLAVAADLSRLLGLHRCAQVVSFHNLSFAPSMIEAGADLRWHKRLAAYMGRQVLPMLLPWVEPRKRVLRPNFRHSLKC